MPAHPGASATARRLVPARRKKVTDFRRLKGGARCFPIACHHLSPLYIKLRKEETVFRYLQAGGAQFSVAVFQIEPCFPSIAAHESASVYAPFRDDKPAFPEDGRATQLIEICLDKSPKRRGGKSESFWPDVIAIIL